MPANIYPLPLWRTVELVGAMSRRKCTGSRMNPSNGELVLYGVVGFERGRGGRRSGSGLVVNGRERRVVRHSESLPFVGTDGGSVTITTHSPDSIDWDHARASAVMNPYLASPRGAAAYEERNRVGPSPRPENVEWTTTTISVDGLNTPFEICDLGDGYWPPSARYRQPSSPLIAGASQSARSLLNGSRPGAPSAERPGCRRPNNSGNRKLGRSIHTSSLRQGSPLGGLLGTTRHRNRSHQTPRSPREPLRAKPRSTGVLLADADPNPSERHSGTVAA